MKNLSIITRHLTVFIFVGTLVGCGTISVPMKVTHPAEINMSKYKQIAFGRMEGNMGESFTNNLKEKLIESGRFTVVDRQRLDQIMKELNLSNSDLANSENAAKLGNLLPATAIISGKLNGNYNESSSSKRKECYNSETKRNYSCTSYTRSGVYTTGGNVDVIDVATGQIMKTKNLSQKYSKEEWATDAQPDAIDKESLAGSCLHDNVNLFFKAISPWDEMVKAEYKTDSDMPELESGINKAKIGEMDGAVAVFQTAAKNAEVNPKIKPKTIAKAYWNIGLTHQFAGNFDSANDAFKKGYELDATDDFMNQLNRNKLMRAENNKLKDQMSN